MNEFGEKLRELRGNKSIREAARGIEISHTYLDSLEKGADPRTGKKRIPTIDVVNKISLYYDYDFFDLISLAGLFVSIRELPEEQKEAQKKRFVKMINKISDDNEKDVKEKYDDLLNEKLNFDETQYLKHSYNFLQTEINDSNNKKEDSDDNDNYLTNNIITMGVMLQKLYQEKGSKDVDVYNDIINDFDDFLKRYLNIK